MASYILDNAWQHERARLARLEAWADPGTIRHLESLDVREGWQVLEVGPGGGSITEWLCRRVGQDGRVVALDIDPRFVEALDQPNLEVRCQNIVTDPVDVGAFDLVFTRGVLHHLPEREAVLRRLAAALKPGGWLLVDEPDDASFLPDPRTPAAAAGLFAKHRSTLESLFAAGGRDLTYGRRLYRDVRACGLVDIGSEGRTYLTAGGSDVATFWRLTWEELGPRAIEAGYITPEELAAFLKTLDDPATIWMLPIWMAVWGRAPA